MYQRGHPYPGVFISFEGGDGAGKTTQYRRLVSYLENKGISLVQTREPGGTYVGEKVRHILLDPDNTEPVEALTEFFLFEASRSQLVDRIIRPALRESKLVLADRFIDSTLAYQGAAGKLSLDTILYGNKTATQECQPDLTVVFDVSADVAYMRMNPLAQSSSERQESFKKGAHGKDRIELRGDEYAERVREAYRGLAKLQPDRVKIIDANKDLDEVYFSVIKEVSNFIRHFGLESKFPI